ncbi:kinase-like domain-containing protein [Gigaspora margarita]|uniref:Kinase-like domain-containing protein n=1 Tax=Gigaspora margarita TaxID=4874 RepID=A0A8H3X6H0_GIGMA|nr:kinase-like domain-containing protein [Gigaspora margarita]
MDYSSLLKNLAKEAGVVVPSNAFKPVNPKLPIRSNTLPTTKVSKCPKCGEPRKTIGWCKPCDTTKLESQFKKWTSGNEYLDSYIRETQINANTPYDFIRWIPYENFTDITFVARGGMGAVYSANSESWGKVALKFLDNSENLTKDFLDELRAYHRCNLGSGIVDCYGVSKDPKTGSYVIVMRYAEHGNLRRYLSNCFTDLTWDEKIVLFDRIGKGLKGIHDNGLVHRDFHSGNILRHEKLVYITDLVRKQSSGSSKKDSSSETPSAFTEEPEEFPSSFIHSDKGKERVLEESRPRVARRHSVARSMTMSTGRVVDKDTIEKIRAERKKLSDYRTSNPMINDHRTSNPMINDLHRQMKLMTIHDSHE